MKPTSENSFFVKAFILLTTIALIIVSFDQATNAELRVIKPEIPAWRVPLAATNQAVKQALTDWALLTALSAFLAYLATEVKIMLMAKVYKEQGADAERQRWLGWNQRREAAIRDKQEFNEPPPAPVALETNGK